MTKPGSRGSKPKVHGLDRRKRRIRRMVLAWVGVILAAAVVRACSLQIQRASRSPFHRNDVTHDPPKP